MDRRYFILVRQAQETAGLANDLAKNANFRRDVDDATVHYLDELLEAVNHARMALYHAVSRQMRNDPQEREIRI